MNLLLAEDDADLSKLLVLLLQKNHYLVDAVADGKTALEYALANHYDGMILDIMMPKMDGLEVLRELRRVGKKTPILLLTAKSELADRVEGLDAGADDYLTKPFAAQELLARIRAMLRRREQYQGSELQYAGVTLSESTYELSFQNQNIRLVTREYQVMELLLRAAGTIVTSDYLMEQVWGWDSDVEVSIVWVIISNLRKRLETLHAPLTIKAVRGVGYCLERKSAND